MYPPMAGSPSVSPATNPSPSEKTKSDAVHFPAHYTKGKIEVWDFIADQGMSYLEGNVIKYVSRFKTKNGLEDLLKAKAYLERLIKEYSK
jgi:hypothetical protein